MRQIPGPVVHNDDEAYILPKMMCLKKKNTRAQYACCFATDSIGIACEVALFQSPSLSFALLMPVWAIKLKYSSISCQMWRAKLYFAVCIHGATSNLFTTSVRYYHSTCKHDSDNGAAFYKYVAKCQSISSRK